MYQIQQLDGAHLPEKTLCLTYDDGPGEHTLAIARFLHEHQIRATFFVVGKYAIQRPAILAELQQLKHIIGNHTYEHPDLPYYVSINGDVQQQILRTDAIIKNFTSEPVFFRPPYGKWSAEVAHALNTNLLSSLQKVGPVYWDIAGIDCYFWQQQKSVEEALESYLGTIREKKKGIIVMHDDIADMDVVKPFNKTFELTQALIPVLIKEGYRFVGLDEINFEGAKAAASCFLFKTGNQFLQQNGKDGLLYATTRSRRKAAAIELTDCTNGRFTLQLFNGNFFSVNLQNEVATIKKNVDEDCYFHLVPVFDNRFVFRTRSGHFLQIEKNTRKLIADASYIRLATVFTCNNIQLPNTEALSFQMERMLLIKKFQFIRRKLLSRLNLIL